MSSIIRKSRKKTTFLQRSYARLCENMAELRAQLKDKEELLETRTRSATSSVDVNGAIKALCYAFGTTLALFICLSNSLTAVAQTLWSDVGDNWTYSWGYLQSHFSPGVLAIGGTFVLHVLFYWTYSGILLWIQIFKPHWIAKFKIQPGTNEPLDLSRVWHGIKVVLCNQVFVLLPVLVIAFLLVKWRGCSTVLPLPSFNWVLLEFAAFALIEEALFYYSHRLLHSKAFYGRFHKQHHEWTSPIACMAMYSHPVEYSFSFIIPMFIGPLVMGSHLAVTWAWMLVGTFTGLNSHCGFHLPFLPSPEAHDFHHQRFTEVFGVLGLFDYLHGTDREFRKSPNYPQNCTFFSASYVSRLGAKNAKGLKPDREPVDFDTGSDECKASSSTSS